ncbi:MAG: hypothetical protein RBR40_12415 [Tenuifilaceae bacterium]|nr:hypothetical protein [Tenuifilaceae bacterium]
MVRIREVIVSMGEVASSHSTLLAMTGRGASKFKVLKVRKFARSNEHRKTQNKSVQIRVIRGQKNSVNQCHQCFKQTARLICQNYVPLIFVWVTQLQTERKQRVTKESENEERLTYNLHQLLFINGTKGI